MPSLLWKMLLLYSLIITRRAPSASFYSITVESPLLICSILFTHILVFPLFLLPKKRGEQKIWFWKILCQKNLSSRFFWFCLSGSLMYILGYTWQCYVASSQRETLCWECVARGLVFLLSLTLSSGGDTESFITESKKKKSCLQKVLKSIEVGLEVYTRGSEIEGNGN